MFVQDSTKGYGIFIETYVERVEESMKSVEKDVEILLQDFLDSDKIQLEYNTASGVNKTERSHDMKERRRMESFESSHC